MDGFFMGRRWHWADDAVFAERQPAIGRPHDQRILGAVESAEMFEQTADAVVEARHGSGPL